MAMTVRTMLHRTGNIRVTGLAALAALLLLTGCTSSPEPYFGWDTQSAAPRRTATHRTNPQPARVAYHPQASCRCDIPVPDARPNYGWQDQASRRYDDYDSRRNSSYDSRKYQDVAAADARFEWPVRGRVLSEFGANAGGERNDGINISADYGTPIRAAEDGVVSYSGNELRGYGNLALLKHDNGYVTAYAHAERFVVRQGDHVMRGQVIGYVGSSGDVRKPQLHFEIRRGAHGEKPVNPRPLLGALQVAYR